VSRPAGASHLYDKFRPTWPSLIVGVVAARQGGGTSSRCTRSDDQTHGVRVARRQLAWLIRRMIFRGATVRDQAAWRVLPRQTKIGPRGPQGQGQRGGQWARA
jgi:hypothetical protein